MKFNIIGLMWASHGKPKNLQNDWGMVWNLATTIWPSPSITHFPLVSPVISTANHRASFSALGDSLFCAKSSSCSTWRWTVSAEFFEAFQGQKKQKKLLADANIKFRIMRFEAILSETPNFVNSILCISNHRILRSWVSMSPIRTRYPKVRYSKVPTGVAWVHPSRLYM